MAALLFTSGSVRYEAVLHRCGRSHGRWVPTCDRVHSWELYSDISLEHQAASTMTCYPTQSHYNDTEPTSPCPILIMPSTRLGSNKYQFQSYSFDSSSVRKCRVQIEIHDLQIPPSPRREVGALTHLSSPTGYGSVIPFQ